MLIIFQSENRMTNLQGDHFPDHMKFPDFSVTFPA